MSGVFIPGEPPFGIAPSAGTERMGLGRRV
jgi:hypothetical protein